MTKYILVRYYRKIIVHNALRERGTMDVPLCRKPSMCNVEMCHEIKDFALLGTVATATANSWRFLFLNFV